MYINMLIEEHNQITRDLNTKSYPEVVRKSIVIALNECERKLVAELFRILGAEQKLY